MGGGPRGQVAAAGSAGLATGSQPVYCSLGGCGRSHRFWSAGSAGLVILAARYSSAAGLPFRVHGDRLTAGFMAGLRQSCHRFADNGFPAACLTCVIGFAAAAGSAAGLSLLLECAFRRRGFAAGWPPVLRGSQCSLGRRLVVAWFHREAWLPSWQVWSRISALRVYRALASGSLPPWPTNPRASFTVPARLRLRSIAGNRVVPACRPFRVHSTPLPGSPMVPRALALCLILLAASRSSVRAQLLPGFATFAFRSLLFRTRSEKFCLHAIGVLDKAVGKLRKQVCGWASLLADTIAPRRRAGAHTQDRTTLRQRVDAALTVPDCLQPIGLEVHAAPPFTGLFSRCCCHAGPRGDPLVWRRRCPPACLQAGNAPPMLIRV